MNGNVKKGSCRIWKRRIHWDGFNTCDQSHSSELQKSDKWHTKYHVWNCRLCCEDSQRNKWHQKTSLIKKEINLTEIQIRQFLTKNSLVFWVPERNPHIQTVVDRQTCHTCMVRVSVEVWPTISRCNPSTSCTRLLFLALHFPVTSQY